MPDDVAASSGILPLQPPPEGEPSPDSQATEKNTDETVESLFADLNTIREDLSAIMADDFKDFQGPTMIGGRVPMNRDRLDREDRRSKLQERERLVQKAIREQTASATPLS